VHLFGEWFVGLEVWKEPKGPYHLWPVPVWVAMEDMDIHVRGGSLSLVFWNSVFQIHIKKWHRLLDDRGFLIEDEEMSALLDELQRRHGWIVEPDAAKIRKMISKTPWLRTIFANGGLKNSYAIALLSQMLKMQEMGENSDVDLEKSMF
jgi:hypothetical protein